MNFLAFKIEGHETSIMVIFSGASIESAEPERRYDPCVV